MGGCLSKNNQQKYAQQHGGMPGGTTHTQLNPHGQMMMSPGVPSSVQHMSPTWMNQQPNMGRPNPAMAMGGQPTMVAQGRPNQPNQYTPNPMASNYRSMRQPQQMTPQLQSGISISLPPGTPSSNMMVSNGSASVGQQHRAGMATAAAASSNSASAGSGGMQHKSSSGSVASQQMLSSRGTNIHGGGTNMSMQSHNYPHQTAVNQTPVNRDSPSRSNKLFIAMFDYTCQTDDDLPFKKGDLLEVESTMGEWWMAVHKANGKRGYIPSNYVEAYRSHRAEPWYMEDVGRLSAECALRECPKGTFLVRPAESRSNEFSLSVKDSNEVKHYRIRMNEDGMMFIAKRSAFSNLVQLVEHYKQHCDGLCVKLAAPIEHNEGPVRTLQSLSKSHEINWEIPINDLKFGDKLGSGQFGEVFRGWWGHNKEVAIKTLKQGTMDKEDFRRESNIMKKLQHKNLVALYGVCIEPLLIVTELAKHGNLLEFFKKADSRLVYKDLIMMGCNVAAGMAYLERNGYVHRDLAARNVLVHKERPITCKIGDFGLARKMTQENIYDAHQGAKFPIKWTAPEAATKNVFTTKSDVWSFGILFYEICTKGRQPYAGMTNADVLREVEKGYRMPKLDCIEQKSYDVMTSCWRTDPNKRPTFEALQHILDDYYTSNDDANYNDDVR